ncbi:MAG: GerMN domain-containing protein, partial [Firmicutes bacterium]|nr:GerMN domain-containing protein [Bacillota bacterium]
DNELKNFTTLIYPVDGNENIAKINFTDSFYSLSGSGRVLCISGMVYTLTELDFLRNVYFYVDNKPVENSIGDASERYNRNNVANNPSLDPEKRDRQLVTLYFTDARQRSLIREERSIEIKQSQTIEYQIVEQLIQGPLDSSLVPTVAADIKIRDIKTEEGICYVNLSADLTARHTTTATELLSIYSVVDSLTELDYVKKVQFLVEGEKVNAYKGGVDISKTVSRDESLIEKEDDER